MSLDNFFDSLLTKTTPANEDQDLFAQYLNLSEYDYNYSDLQPTDQLPSLVSPHDPLPPVVHPTAPSSKVYLATSHPSGSAPSIPSIPLATPVTDSLSLLHCPPTDNRMCNLRALRPTGLGTTATYWNTRAAYTAGRGTVDMGTPCLSRHACIAVVSSNPRITNSLLTGVSRIHPFLMSAQRSQT
jgi:hypothetical protein